MPAIASPTAERPSRAARWIGRGSLTRRILAVNIIALALVGGSLFYLDGFRLRLIEERRAQKETQLRVVAAALATASPAARPATLDAIARTSRDHLRVYDAKGALVLDSWSLGPRTFRFNDPHKEEWPNRAARWIDALVDRVVAARIPPPFIDQGKAPATAWPELVDVMNGANVSSRVRLAPDRTIVTTAVTPVDAARTFYLLSVENPQDVTRLVRAERLRLALIVVAALLLSGALSWFLARTIVRPLRSLAQAAVRVRLGRARDVIVPRLPTRSDEIGMLARAVSDMTQALRERIDAIECFAADVAHELKNPLASLSSAVESLDRVDDPLLRHQLAAIIAGDVHRLDRLITDIADMSRLDAQLTRALFERIDLCELVSAQVAARGARSPGGPALSFAASPSTSHIVLGDAGRLARVLDNLIDNALSFSPSDGRVLVRVQAHDADIILTVEDDGPGVPAEARDLIFDRFHSDRPDPAAFGKHSGLGLAIAKTIVEGHNGTITVEDRDSHRHGARFVVRLPAA